MKSEGSFLVREGDQTIGVWSMGTAPTPFLKELLARAALEGEASAQDPEGCTVTAVPCETTRNAAECPAQQEREMNPIVKYVVRVPGSTSWSEHKTLSSAHREAEAANRICRPGHQVFAEHQDGAVTGPYPKGARLEA